MTKPHVPYLFSMLYENRGAILIALEHGMGQTRFGSLLGLAWHLLFGRLKSDDKIRCPRCGCPQEERKPK